MPESPLEGPAGNLLKMVDMELQQLGCLDDKLAGDLTPFKRTCLNFHRKKLFERKERDTHRAYLLLQGG